MPTNILMPALSPTMETGTLTKWYVKEGDEISPGEILADIETDKATMEFEAIENGKITKIIVPEGTKDILVNSPIAEISLEDEVLFNQNTNPITENNTKNPHDSLSNPNTAFTDTTDNSKEVKSNDETRIKISPLAKKIAANHNIDIDDIIGTGPNGRIVKSDIISLLDSQPVSNNTMMKNKRPNNMVNTHDENLQSIINMFDNRQYELIPTTNIRKIVAQRLTIAKQSIPHFYLRRTIQMGKLIKLRAELNDSLSKSGIKISINDFIIKAAAKSLQDNPKCNVIWGEENIIQLKSSDISVAVAIDDGLITPIIFDAEQKGIQEISIEIKEKATKAREKKLRPEEYTGGSFSISNLGMMGVENFDAVINPPQASILAVGSSVKKALVNDLNEIFIGEVMSVNLSADHRVIDGAIGALFIESIVDYLSNPLKLLI